MKVLALLLIYNSLSAQYCIDSENVYSFYYNGVKYDIVKENKSWKEAAHCAYSRGGILSHINNQEEQDALFSHLNNAEINPLNTVALDGGGASYVWIGGNDITEEGKWIWDGSDDGTGTQFWEGNFAGNPVNDLFNNWGNEPDNSGNQDGLGLAITDWPRGLAGEWNDILASNRLYFVIEYDNSIIRINETKFNHQGSSIIINSSLPGSFDSIFVFVNDELNETLLNVSEDDSVITTNFNVEETMYVEVQLIGYFEESLFASRKHSVLIYKFNNPLTSYSTDFEDNQEEFFIGEGFEIKREFGFANKAIHSEHDYQARTNFSFSLINPIIISEDMPIMIYSEVALVEPGDVGTEYGDNAFKDYVLVEGSKNADDWLPLAIGYDSRLHENWENAWYSPTAARELFQQHTINLSDSFAAGDTILIRFRLFSDEDTAGWGWVIDSLQIQEFPLSIDNIDSLPQSFSLKQNYPNPFNPTTVIRYQLPVASNVNLKVYNILGKKIATLVNKKQSPGNYHVTFDAAKLSSGIYFYKLTAGNYASTKKMVLMR